MYMRMTFTGGCIIFRITRKFNILQHHYIGLGLGCFTSLSTIFQLYRGCQFYWCRPL